MSVMKLELPYLVSDADRHGNVRLYVRRNGRKVRLREVPGTPAFAKAYSDALDELEAPRGEDGPKAAPAGTLGWLAAQYFGSDEFKKLDPQSQLTRRAILEDCLREPRRPGSSDLMAACPIGRLSSTHVRMLRDRKAGLPGAANNRRKYLSAMFGWAVEEKKMVSNPARDVRRVKYNSKGFHTWSLEEVQTFVEHHKIGSKAVLALGLLMFLGARRGDMVTLGRQHMKDGGIRYVPHKTLYVRRDATWKPILPVLKRIIEASPTGEMTFLVTEYGLPFTAKGFGGWFRARCDDAKLYHCTSHGLRKAGATVAAENGATVHQLMALYDWSTPEQAMVYTRAAEQKRLAGEAGKLIANFSSPTRLSHRKKRKATQ